MKKKKFVIVLATAAIVFLAVFCAPYLYAATLPRKVYTENDRTMYLTGYEELGSVAEPSLSWCIELADFVGEVTVLTDGEELTDETTRYTRYKMLVNDIWYGKCGNRILDIYIYGHPAYGPGLTKGSRAVLFVRRNRDFEGPYRYARYRVVDDRCVYIINPPDDMLFSLSGEAVPLQYENKAPDELKTDIREQLEKIGMKYGELFQSAF